MGKVLKDITASHVTTHLESQHLLSSRQFEFRNGLSAVDLILLLATKYSNAQDQGRPMAVLELDIAGAFGCLWHAALVERLCMVGVGGILMELLHVYLQ